MTTTLAPPPCSHEEILSTIRFPVLPPESCSQNVEGETYGTATRTRGWVGVEVPGQWGRDILKGGSVHSALARRIARKVKKLRGYKLLFIREPASRGSQSQQKRQTHRIFIVNSAQGKQHTYRFEVPHLEKMLSLPLHSPQKIKGVKKVPHSLIFLCTHGKRDRCCALAGRPIAQYLKQVRPPETVWECSHIGGHRLAPTGVVLPAGYMYGRLTPAAALMAVVSLEEYQVPSLAGIRGCSSLAAVHQVAEVAVREYLAQGGEEPTISQLSFSSVKSEKSSQKKKNLKKSREYRQLKKKYARLRKSRLWREQKARAKVLRKKLSYGQACVEELVELNELNRRYREVKEQYRREKYALLHGGQDTGSSQVFSSAYKGVQRSIVHHEDGRSWIVVTAKTKTAPARESCGKGEKPLSTFKVLSVEKASHRR
ncbi:sucrase ferredoxin [Rothia sp. P7208]|uniref:sucrase ferredoxin n=1 Tax=Rothia sp. P7208 TaxID=3402660 RepID=UPI003AC9347A